MKTTSIFVLLLSYALALAEEVLPAPTGAVDWLLVCPRKDFFVPIDSELTDAL